MSPAVDRAAAEMTAVRDQLLSALGRIHNGDFSDLGIVRQVARQMADPGRLSHLGASRVPGQACRVLLTALSQNVSCADTAARVATALFGNYQHVPASGPMRFLKGPQDVPASPYGDMCAALGAQVTRDLDIATELHRVLGRIRTHLQAPLSGALETYIAQVCERPSHLLYDSATIGKRLAAHPRAALPEGARIIDEVDGEPIYAFDLPGMPTMDGLDANGLAMPQQVIWPAECTDELDRLQRDIEQMNARDREHWQPAQKRVCESDLRTQERVRLEEEQCAARVQARQKDLLMQQQWATTAAVGLALHHKRKEETKRLDQHAASTQGRNALNRQMKKRATTHAIAEAARAASHRRDEQRGNTAAAPASLPASTTIAATSSAAHASPPHLVRLNNMGSMGSISRWSMSSLFHALDQSAINAAPLPPGGPVTPPSSIGSIRRLLSRFPDVPDAPIGGRRTDGRGGRPALPLMRD